MVAKLYVIRTDEMLTNDIIALSYLILMVIYYIQVLLGIVSEHGRSINSTNVKFAKEIILYSPLFFLNFQELDWERTACFRRIISPSTIFYKV